MVVDDQAVVRAGFAAVIDAEPDLTVVGEAGDGAAAVVLVERTAPDVVLMDIRMPGMDGLTATRLITALPNAPKVLVLTTFDLDAYVYEALRAGSSGFMLKDAQPEDVLSAIRVVAAGEGILAPAVTRRLIGQFARGAPVPPEISGQLAGMPLRHPRGLYRGPPGPRSTRHPPLPRSSRRARRPPCPRPPARAGRSGRRPGTRWARAT
ncbi:Protein-glutamate methylesterase/protein-glutamine glutaminase [Streptomyces fumanus]